MLSLFLIAISVLEFSPVTKAIFLPIWSKRNLSDSSFYVPITALALENGRKSPELLYYADLAKNFSLDHRCENGLALSIAWHQYPPYTIVYQPKTKHKRTRGLAVDGMFPGILKAALSSCCHKKSTVLFGKLLKSVRNAENHIDEDTFDLTFPLYGYDSSANLFR